MLVRTAGAADVDQVMRLRGLWRDAAITAEFVASFGSWFQHEQSHRWWWLAIDDAGVGVGMVNVKLFERMPSPSAPPSRWGYLANLFVAPPARGAGIGSRLVEAAVDRASGSSCRHPSSLHPCAAALGSGRLTSCSCTRCTTEPGGASRGG
jgi:GNAT superfamily N-acetyltransferase